MNEKERQLKLRTRKFVLDVLNLVDKLPNRRSSKVVGDQLGRCATSVAANYRAACRGRSGKEFISKIGVVEEEADESTFWLDILNASNNATKEEVEPLLKEARELTAIFTASSKTAKRNNGLRTGKVPKIKNSSISKTFAQPTNISSRSDE
jgi:four helix bundle protein